MIRKIFLVYLREMEGVKLVDISTFNRSFELS